MTAIALAAEINMTADMETVAIAIEVMIERGTVREIAGAAVAGNLLR
jgi:hypothetical protein